MRRALNPGRICEDLSLYREMRPRRPAVIDLTKTVTEEKFKPAS